MDPDPYTFEQDRALFMKDLDTAQEKCITEGGMRLKWLPELHDRLADLKRRALSTEFGQALGLIQSSRIH